ncbi:MAG: thioredoxin family protein [Gemmatimonadetes bacterium]|nr:thioredoxin family protein [Gemmatimonadota bacterium]
MVSVPSTMLDLGTAMPTFSLANAVDDRVITDRDVRGVAGTLVMFICNHCPFVKHVMPELSRVASDYQPKGFGVVAINANDAQKYPQDAPPEMKKLVAQEQWAFPFLFDETQAVAKAFHAACTPDFFVFDRAGKLAYRGQLDDSRPSTTVPVTGGDLRKALDAVIAGRVVDEQMPSIGCNIKWTQGNEPEYFAKR